MAVVTEPRSRVTRPVRATPPEAEGGNSPRHLGAEAWGGRWRREAAESARIREVLKTLDDDEDAEAGADPPHDTDAALQAAILEAADLHGLDAGDAADVFVEAEGFLPTPPSSPQKPPPERVGKGGTAQFAKPQGPAKPQDEVSAVPGVAEVHAAGLGTPTPRGGSARKRTETPQSRTALRREPSGSPAPVLRTPRGNSPRRPEVPLLKTFVPTPSASPPSQRIYAQLPLAHSVQWLRRKSEHAHGALASARSPQEKWGPLGEAQRRQQAAGNSPPPQARRALMSNSPQTVARLSPPMRPQDPKPVPPTPPVPALPVSARDRGTLKRTPSAKRSASAAHGGGAAPAGPAGCVGGAKAVGGAATRSASLGKPRGRKEVPQRAVPPLRGSSTASARSKDGARKDAYARTTAKAAAARSGSLKGSPRGAGLELYGRGATAPAARPRTSRSSTGNDCSGNVPTPRIPPAGSSRLAGPGCGTGPTPRGRPKPVEKQVSGPAAMRRMATPGREKEKTEKGKVRRVAGRSPLRRAATVTATPRGPVRKSHEQLQFSRAMSKTAVGKEKEKEKCKVKKGRVPEDDAPLPPPPPPTSSSPPLDLCRRRPVGLGLGGVLRDGAGPAERVSMPSPPADPPSPTIAHDEKVMEAAVIEAPAPLPERVPPSPTRPPKALQTPAPAPACVEARANTAAGAADTVTDNMKQFMALLAAPQAGIAKRAPPAAGDSGAPAPRSALQYLEASEEANRRAYIVTEERARKWIVDLCGTMGAR